MRRRRFPVISCFLFSFSLLNIFSLSRPKWHFKRLFLWPYLRLKEQNIAEGSGSSSASAPERRLPTLAAPWWTLENSRIGLKSAKENNLDDTTFNRHLWWSTASLQNQNHTKKQNWHWLPCHQVLMLPGTVWALLQFWQEFKYIMFVCVQIGCSLFTTRQGKLALNNIF